MSPISLAVLPRSAPAELSFGGLDLEPEKRCDEAKQGHSLTSPTTNSMLDMLTKQVEMLQQKMDDEVEPQDTHVAPFQVSP